MPIKMLLRTMTCALALAGCDWFDTGDAPEAAAADASGEARPDATEPSPPSGLPSAEAVLDKAAEAAGGNAQFAKIESFYYEGQVEVLGQKLEARAKTWWKRGDFYTEQDMLGVGKVRAGKSGDTIWSDEPINGLRKLDGLEAEQVTWASSLLLAADWKRFFTSAETVGERTVDGRKVYDVLLKSASGGEITMTFDAESGLQVGQSFSHVTPMGTMPLQIKLEDYREVGGIKVAYRQVTDASLATAALQLDKLELNVAIEEARFQMPVSGADTVEKTAPPPPAP